MSVDKTLKGYSIAEVASPCTATNVLTVKVGVAPPWILLVNWLRIHLRGGRPNKVRHWLLLGCGLTILVAGLWFFLWARFLSVEAVAPTEPPAAQASASVPLPGSYPSARTAEGRSWSPLFAEATRAELVRAVLLVLGPLSIAFVAAVACRMRPTLCEVYVVGLLPHEPFPVIEQFLARSFDKHVIAIRFLNEAAKERFFGKLVSRLNKDGSSWRATRWIAKLFGKSEPSTLTTLDITHASVGGVVRPQALDERQHYWSLVRYGIGLMLARHGVVRQSAIGFTYKLHEWFFIFYFGVLGLVVALPSIGWLPKSDESQFPLMMVGVGVIWAAVLIVVHLGVVEHLGAWERMSSAKMPFNGCPIYRYSEQHVASGEWEELELQDFQAPIRDLGLPSDRMLELTLSVMLIIYLTALQIVK